MVGTAERRTAALSALETDAMAGGDSRTTAAAPLADVVAFQELGGRLLQPVGALGRPDQLRAESPLSLVPSPCCASCRRTRYTVDDLRPGGTGTASSANQEIGCCHVFIAAA